VIVELAQQKVLRAIYSERQLQEVLTDFWFNHFNVDARKGRDRFLLTEYERETIRPHVLGKFRDLLEATAKSPAMLFYLDNWLSADPSGPHMEMLPPRVARSPFGGRVVVPGGPRPRPQGKNAPKGLNENYGRELMELHTLGVDGGYTQKDVTEVARAFTGWTIDNPRQGGRFMFNPRLHDTGQKVVLGHVIKAGGGESDGEQVLDILAREPATARLIATKLARRFVSDTPPPALVDRAAARFQATDGDLREVTRTILTSPEFVAAESYRAKVKTPFEFVVSAARALGADGAGRAAARPSAAAAWDAPLSVPAADRLQGHGGRVGQHRRAGQPYELRADACGQQAARRVGGVAAGRRRGTRRRFVGDDARDDRQGGRCPTDGRTDPRFPGISTAVKTWSAKA
jgi:uncharacterized protein (DUF1800 family)